MAEELIFRQLAFNLSRHVGVASAVSVLLYALAQLGSGSFIVGALALGCGSVWTYLRVRTDSLLAPLLAHGIWTPIVIFLVPLA